VTMQLQVTRLYGLRCESCEHGNRAGIQAWEFTYAGKRVYRLLCYLCAIIIADRWTQAGGVLVEARAS
jgi:hypothetical protein